MAKRSSGTRKIPGASKPFSVKVFQDDYDATDKKCQQTGIPKAVLFRLVYREALREGFLDRVVRKK